VMLLESNDCRAIEHTPQPRGIRCAGLYGYDTTLKIRGQDEKTADLTSECQRLTMEPIHLETGNESTFASVA
jgi:hypothetical protein